MVKFKVKDKFRINSPYGSFGEITSVRQNWPHQGDEAYYATYYYGLDVRGNPMTARSGLLKPSEIVPVTEEEFLIIRNREGEGDAVTKMTCDHSEVTLQQHWRSHNEYSVECGEILEDSDTSNLVMTGVWSSKCTSCGQTWRGKLMRAPLWVRTAIKLIEDKLGLPL